MIRDHYLKDRPRKSAMPPWRKKSLALLPRVWELSEFVVKKLGVEDVGAYYPHRVTYHASCHGLRNLQLGDAPLRLAEKLCAASS